VTSIDASDDGFRSKLSREAFVSGLPTHGFQRRERTSSSANATAPQWGATREHFE
jgi:hypothetical protein